MRGLANVGRVYAKQGDYVNAEKLPKHLINAVIATEDRRFFNHAGVDIIGIIRPIIVCKA